jgi:hypothetical protein
VDLKTISWRKLRERWKNCTMGLKPSPYVCIKGLLLALEIVVGHQMDPKTFTIEQSPPEFAWRHAL